MWGTGLRHRWREQPTCCRLCAGADRRSPSHTRHRPPVPVPRLLKEGVSEAQVKDVAAKVTVHLNKGLGERAMG